MANKLTRPEPPALPLAPDRYERPYVDQTNNVFRLFFNRLVATLSSLFSVDNGGKFLYFPRGVFYSTSDQTAALASTGYLVTFNQTSVAYGVSIVSNTQITATDPGTYKFDVTLQYEHNNANNVTVWVWSAKNGVDVPYSGHKFSVAGNNDGVLHWGFEIALAGGDYVEIYWATSDTDLNLHTETATSPHPGMAAATASVSFNSNS